jgi:transposase
MVPFRGSRSLPTEAQEGVRDLTRCRDDIRADVVRWRHRVLKVLARHGHVYQPAQNWTQAPLGLDPRATLPRHRPGARPRGSLEALEQALRRRADLDRTIEGLAAEPRYSAAVGALRCFRGINTLSAMILVAEIVDFHRFSRPRALMAYLGLVPSEYSSGDRTRRGALTRAGNTHARRVFVEAAWHYRHRPALGSRLARATATQAPAIVAEAWRAQQRLHRRYRHLVSHGKRPPVAVAAVARELVGFLWAALTHTPRPAAA